MMWWVPVVVMVAFVAIVALGVRFAPESEYERFDRRLRDHSDRVKVDNAAFAEWKHMSYGDAQWFAANGYDNPLRYFDTMRRASEVQAEKERRTVTAVFCDPVTGKSVTGTWRLNPDGTEHSFKQERGGCDVEGSR